MSDKKALSLSDLDATKASAEAFEFEYLIDGEPSGIFFSVLGGQSEVVTREVAELINAKRRRDVARAVRAKSGKPADFDPIEEDIEFGQRLAAVRLVGWRGISDPFTPENALKLCQTNRDIAAKITEESDNIANFMKL